MQPFTKEQTFFLRKLLYAEKDTLLSVVRTIQPYIHLQTGKPDLLMRVLTLATEDVSNQKESVRLQREFFRALLCERGLAKEEWFQNDDHSSPQTESGSGPS